MSTTAERFAPDAALGATILVVDDSPANLSVVSDCLKDSGFQILVARDGVSALEKARYSRPDLILLDVLMPEMDGFETCRRLKVDEALQNIPVIFMTALTETQDKVKGFQLGAVDYVTKPFQADELLARVSTHLRLYELTERLEQQVRQRTKDLRLANQQLRQVNDDLMREIAERKRVEAALRESEERYHSLFEGVPVGLYRTTPEGRIVDANTALARMLGVANRETLLAASVVDRYTNPEVRARWLASVEQQDVVRDFEAQLRRDDGTVIWVEDNARVVHDAQGQALHYEGSLKDITERKQAAQMLVQAERLAAMGKVAASVAHEINNPLQLVIGYLELARRALTGQEDVAEYVQIACNEMFRVADIVAQLRNLGRPVSGEKELANVNELLEQVLLLNRKQCQNSGVDVIWKPAEDLPLVLLVPDQMKQVFLNLVLNAIDAMSGGGRLQISTSLTSQPAGVRIEFADNGVGIAPDALPYLFEPFYSTKPEGTGLGLAISYRIVKEHRGRIDVHSREGQGSTFSIFLPG